MSTYNSPTDVNPITRALSATPNGIDAACATAFALLPDETLLKQGKVTYAADSANVADAYTITLAVSPASYADGLLISFRPLVTNSGASTINVNGLGVKSIRNIDSTALGAGAVVAGSPCVIQYSTATGYFHLLTSALYQQASGSFATLNGVETISSKTITPTSILPSVSLESPWAYVSTENAAVFSQDQIVTFSFNLTSNAGSSTILATFPANYRPAGIRWFVGFYFDSSAGSYHAVAISVTAAGVVSVGNATDVGIITPAVLDGVKVSGSFAISPL